jgi:hypothetical protein
MKFMTARELLPTRHETTHARDVASTENSAAMPYTGPRHVLRSRLASHGLGMAVAHATTMHSSNTRGKVAFVPWMAALVIGATAHGGWLIHDQLRHHEAQPLIVNVDARPEPPTLEQPTLEQPKLEQPKLERRERTRTQTAARCRHAQLEVPTAEPLEDLDLWVHQTARHVYAIDRRMLDHIALTDFDVTMLERLQPFGGRARSAIELRNIRHGTPLYLLGLRNGDRVLALFTAPRPDEVGASRSRPEIERLVVTLERRGQPLALVYEII